MPWRGGGGAGVGQGLAAQEVPGPRLAWDGGWETMRSWRGTRILEPLRWLGLLSSHTTAEAVVFILSVQTTTESSGYFKVPEASSSRREQTFTRDVPLYLRYQADPFAREGIVSPQAPLGTTSS